MSDNFQNWRDGKLLLIALSIVLSTLLYATWGTLVAMEHTWGTKEEYGYAYIIPLITGYFIWIRRYQLTQVRFSFSWVGLILSLVGVFIILLGKLSATNSIMQYGFIITLISSIYTFIGFKALKVIAGPLLLLFLIVPLPAFIYNNLSSQLQLISSLLGVWFIRLFDISVFLEGNVIDLGVYKLQVVEACSGLRYLFPLFSLSVISAFIYRAALWKRIVLVLSSLPITVFMNSVRIGVIGVLVDNYGIEQAEGFLHDFEGWVIFMACTVLLVIEMKLLLLIGQDKKSLAESFAIDEVVVPEKPYANNYGVISRGSVVSMVLIMLSLLSSVMISQSHDIIVERQTFASFPLSYEGWTGRTSQLDSETLEALVLDDYLLADYQNENGKHINLYMAYYAAQRAGVAAHSPASCIPGGGWRIEDLSTYEINIPSADLAMNVNRLLITKGQSAQLVYYWFPQRGRVITNEYLVKWYLFWDSLTRSRSDGALVRFTTNINLGNNESIASADERLLELIRLTQPKYSEFIPE